MRSFLTGCLLLLALAGTLLFTATCAGGAEGEELTLEEYFQEVEKLYAGKRKRAEETWATLYEESPESEEEFAGVLGDVVDGSRDIGAWFRDGLDRLNPPSELESAHDDLVAAYDKGVRVLEDLDIGDLESEADLAEVASDVERQSAGIGEEQERACFALQAIADENHVLVDLRCEEGGGGG